MQEYAMRRAADNVRVLAAAMIEKAKSGHPGGSMGGADIVNVLYSKYLVYDPEDPTWISRDRFFLDPGHQSAMLYTVLAMAGKFTMEELKQFRQWGSVTPGHPEKNYARGIENTSGPLGQGHAFGIGAAIAERFLVARFGEVWAHKTYVFISDGGVQEEISQGAGRIAGFLKLSNLIMFYDSNDVQLSTMCDEVTGEDTAAKYRSWGWKVTTVDGHDPKAMGDAIESAQAETECPTLIICKTIMGKGCVTADGEKYESKCSIHGAPLSKSGASYERTIENLGGDPKDPWHIWPEVEELYARRASELKEIVAERKAAQEAWKKKNPELWATFKGYIEGKIPQIDYSQIKQKANQATRSSSATVLSVLGEKVGNMIVSSADLSNSDKSEAFLKKTGAITAGNFNGGFIHAGVAELTMAALMNGIVLHGAMQAACATFFVFSDYMKPVLRMSALMELPVKYIWTHDAFRVGEDGPTHEPIEQESQVRLLEEIRNSLGQPSMLVLRPADAAETTVAWKMAMENTTSPTGLILSRQDVPDLPSLSGDRYADALKMQRGGYIVYDAPDGNPDVVLVGNGSEVSTLDGAAKLLSQEGINCRLVSMPSLGLFSLQESSYRESVIPSAGKPVFGLSAGLPSMLRPVLPITAKIYGLQRFGASAPASVLDEKFGFTPSNIASEVKKYIGR